MKFPRIVGSFFGSVTLIVLNSTFGALAAEKQRPAEATYSRQAVFELTYRNSDLTWLGDPASPNALAYPKMDAKPVATDFHVSTIAETSTPHTRRYFREARIAKVGDERKIYAFTERRERVIGTIDANGHFASNNNYAKDLALLPSWPSDPSVLRYDGDENALYIDVEAPGPVVTESLDFLPLQLADVKANPIRGVFEINYTSASERDGAMKPAVVSLVLRSGKEPITLATANVPKLFRRSDMQLGSFDNDLGTYLPEAAYRTTSPGGDKNEPGVTVTLIGRFTDDVTTDTKTLALATRSKNTELTSATPPAIAIDGKFDDWRNVPGVDDPRGDLVPYLEYVPDVDLLEFKIAHDNEHVYLYARVAGRVGHSYPKGGRSYFYAYMDVDQNPETGFLPSRDDECYYGVDIGDDCEVQFEFIDNAFLKAFYGFCGLGGDNDVLKQVVTIGRSQYGRLDENGNERAHYKSEYIYRDDATEITEDLKPGTSDTIQVAVSPDGSEVEVVSSLTGFLKDRDGRPTVALGQTIDVAAGMESDSKVYPGKSRWAADSTVPIRAYRLSPLAEQRDVDKQAAD